MLRSLLLLAILIPTTPLWAEPPAVALHLTGHVGNSPADIWTKITIEQHEDNREACLFWVPTTPTGVYGSRCWTIDGANEPRTRQMWIKRLTTGEYEVYLKLARTLSVVKSNTEIVKIIGF